MDEIVFPPTTLLNTITTDSFMDLDYMNEEFLLESCNWLDRIDKSPVLESNNVHFNGTMSKSNQDDRQRSSFPFGVSPNISTPRQSRRCLVEGYELKATNSITDRLVRAVEYIKDLSRDKDVLIQIWVPVSRGDRRVLTTSDQPFKLNNNCPRLAHYREISVDFQFPLEDTNESFGLPARVFLGKVPEWTPDVQLYMKEEYPRVGHAQLYNVRGTIAVPVFEQSSRCCLGVVEVVFTTQRIKYLPHLESVCKALEAVNLRGSVLPTARNVKACDLTYEAVLHEILEVFKSACETHRLPLAQTWVPCVKQGCYDENLIRCVSTMDSACYVADPSVQGFHEACSEHHLLTGQGVVGRAFLTNQACFLADVTSSSKAEYPLSHYAKMFGLQASVAIRLRSISISSADFILEFFLPRKCNSPEEHRRMLTSLSILVQNICQTLQVITDQELQQETGEEALKLENKFPPGPYEIKSTRGEGKMGSKKRLKAEKTVTLKILQQYFAGSLRDAARSIGVCPTTLKRICRQHGIKRWPSRKIKTVGQSLQKIKRVIDSVQGGLQIESYTKFTELMSVSPNSVPNQFKNPKSDHEQPRQSDDELISLSSSCSQCCSTGTQLNPDTLHSAGHGNVFSRRDLKRIKSATELHSSRNGLKTLPRCQSHASLVQHSQSRWVPPNKGGDHRSREDALRVKVSFGEENIRMHVKNSWGYDELLREIATRFGVVDNSAGFQVKYLDDDTEWVLLTCDADLQECFDVCRSLQNQIIKLAFHRVSQHSR